ncbi:unnamed protein product [Closterium sp. NIES-64]|nr:unnamed protein product [Closterium sp. NIES-65]CAI5971474.1 unnamed protein product [Closterium sp. NIES-64]CAI5989143.1 unnamed protein product [Closterium sp. NIES-65]
MATAIRAAVSAELASVATSAATRAPTSLTSAFVGSFKPASLSTFSAAPLRAASVAKRPVVRAAVATDKPATAYQNPTWARFELGLAPVFWETATGLPPASGELMTIWFNPEASTLTPNPEFGVAFNGGFNSPIMCGGEARRMSRKDRGPSCAPLFSIKVNVPLHAKTIEFSMTDGEAWDGPYVVEMQIPAAFRNQPMSFFNEGLKKTLEAEGACDDTIFPDSQYVPDRCIMPGGIAKEEGQSCRLDLVPGCMDPSSPFFDPLANVDDGSCPIDVPQK